MEDKRLLRLVKRARFGDKNAFCELIQEKSRKIVFIATNLMGNGADGEDAAQEAVITLARKIGTLKKAELFDAWMYRIIYNVCMDEKRKRSRKLDESGELDVAIAVVAEKNSEVLPEEKLEDAADREAIMAALNDLPERYRMCVLLFYYEDMSYAEIAETLQVSEQVVANTLNRAKEKLRMNFEKVTDGSRDLVGAGTTAKVGAFLPAAAVIQAIAFNESATVMPSAVASVSSAAAAVAMPKGLIFSRIVESAVTKTAAGVACAVALVAGTVYMATPLTLPEPQPIVQEAPAPAAAPEAEPEEAPAVHSARVDGLPEGAQTTVLAQGQDDVALDTFKRNLDGFEVLTSLENDGYSYVLYHSLANENDYVLTIEPLSE